jgi:hypothetical protein
MLKTVIEMGSFVLLLGTMKGMGREVDCEVLARKEYLPANSHRGQWVYEYSQYSVLKAPEDLPDGAYTVLTSDGHTICTTKQGGFWLAGPTRKPGDVDLPKPA